MDIQTRRQQQHAERVALQSVYVYGASHGLLGLPIEIHLEILSYKFPEMPVPTLTKRDEDTVYEMGGRWVTMTALSQTCRALRDMYLSRLWQRVEQFHGMHSGIVRIIPRQTRSDKCRHTWWPVEPLFSKNPHGIDQAIRQFQVVTVRQPSLAQNVQVVNFVFKNGYSDSVLNAMANSLPALPNLHTVQLCIESYFHYRFQWPETSPFDGHQYPQIRTLSLTQESLHFAQYCPEVRVIVPYHTKGFLSFPEERKKLEVLGLTEFTQSNSLTLSTSGLSNLRDISVMTRSKLSTIDEVFKDLRGLPLLNTIRFRMDKEWDIRRFCLDQADWSSDAEHKDVEQRVQMARQILLENEGDNSRKKIVVTYRYGDTKTFAMKD